MHLPRSFPSTQWTRLERERGQDGGKDWFCETYRPAILAYFRRHVTHHDAEDLCQEFLRQVVLDGPLVERAERHRGSLRALLRKSLSRFLADHWRRRGSQKRGGGVRHCDINELDAADGTSGPAESNGDEPDRAFDRAWARLLLERAVAKAEQHFADQGKAALAAALRPLLEGAEPVPSHLELATQFGISSREVTLTLRSLRLRVSRNLHDEVVATVSANGSVADEMEAIHQALRRD